MHDSYYYGLLVKNSFSKIVKESFNKLIQSIPSVLTNRSKQDKQEEIKVLLVDDNDLFRGGLRKMIENQDDLVVIGEATDGKEAIELARKLIPDVITMDVKMPRINGIKATRIITDDLPKIRIIGLSLNNEDKIIEEMKNAGADVYLQKSKVHGSLVETIRKDQIKLSNLLYT